MDTKTEDFLKAVKHEIDMLRIHATDIEKSRLNFESFNPIVSTLCIYGQMTGHCSSSRAKELMDNCCIKVLDVPSSQIKYYVENRPIEELPINGSYEAQTWKNEMYIYDRRNFQYLSALEGYILSLDANNKDVIAYIKEEIKTLEL